MKASLSRQRIAQIFDELDGQLTVVTFDSDSNRTSAYSGLNPFLALADVATKLVQGKRTLILLVKRGTRLPMHINEIPEELIWNPGWKGENKFK